MFQYLFEVTGQSSLDHLLLAFSQLTSHADNIRVRMTVVAEGLAGLLRVLVATPISTERDALLKPVLPLVLPLLAVVAVAAVVGSRGQVPSCAPYNPLSAFMRFVLLCVCVCVCVFLRNANHR